MAVGKVILGDKEKAGEYKKYNEGHVPDLRLSVRIGGGGAWLGKCVIVVVLVFPGGAALLPLSGGDAPTPPVPPVPQMG